MSLATLLQLQDASTFSLYNPAVMAQAFAIMDEHDTYTEDEMREQLYALVSLVSSFAVSTTASIFMTEDELDAMNSEMDELEGMGL